MEPAKEYNPTFPMFYEISHESLEAASKTLTKKGKNALMNFINACCCGKIEEANTFKRIYDDCEEHLNFIETIVEKL